MKDLRAGLAVEGLGWVIDADISKCLDSIDHKHLRGFLDRRINDGVVRRMIDKWLAAGVLDNGVLQRTEEGTPQGGVISPTLWECSHNRLLWIVRSTFDKSVELSRAR